MSQTQYKTLMSNLLNEKHALAKIRAELKGRKGKLCRCCKEFGHLAQNCRNKKREEKEIVVVMLCKRLGKISDILHLNNENNQFKKRARPPKDVPLDAQSWTRAYHLSSRVVAVTTTTETS